MAKHAKKLSFPGAKSVAPVRSIPKEDMKWRARDDAHTLASAAEITADPKRMDMAKKAGQELKKEHETKAHNLKSIFGRGK
jgi:hypothetical protein